MQPFQTAVPRLIISALRGGSGKTVLSIGLIAALKAGGESIAPFKKGPDYIDAGWLALAADRPCYNLDTYLCSPEVVTRSFRSHVQPTEFAVVEGNRGLFDGIDLDGTTSTAELAKLLDLPVILCLDCTKATRTIAATVLGCLHFDADVPIKGVVLNRVAGPRHEKNIRNNIEQHCGVPVVGAIGKLKKKDFPERHMGLLPTFEHQWAQRSVSAAAEVVTKSIDLDFIRQISNEGVDPGEKEIHSNDAIEVADIARRISPDNPVNTRTQSVRIGIVKDSAFQFYYPDNLEALETAGAQLKFISPLSDNEIPVVDALYIGGGFPETHVELLSNNVGFRTAIKKQAENGLPIYAECGGLMYLGDAIVLEGISYPMAGVLPLVCGLSKRPQGHGYTALKVKRNNPFFKKDTVIKGHEFHYSKVSEWYGLAEDLVFEMERGTGFLKHCDGVMFNNVLALYTHIHALGTPEWAPSMVKNARKYQNEKGSVPD